MLLLIVEKIINPFLFKHLKVSDKKKFKLSTCSTTSKDIITSNFNFFFDKLLISAHSYLISKFFLVALFFAVLISFLDLSIANTLPPNSAKLSDKIPPPQPRSSIFFFI